MAAKQLLLLARVCAIVAGSLAASATFAQVDRVDGYDGFKFGMSEKEAAKINPSAIKTDCHYKNVLFCFDYATSVSGLPAVVHVQFWGNPARIMQVVVMFDSLKEPVQYPCGDAQKKVFEWLTGRYGANPYVRPFVSKWTFPDGSEISLTSMCANDRLGFNVVSYKSTGSPGGCSEDAGCG